MKYVEEEHVDQVVRALMPRLPNVSEYGVSRVVEEVLGLDDPEIQTVVAQHLTRSTLVAEVERRGLRVWVPTD